MAFAYQTITEASARQNIFNTLAKLINDNKLTGWTVLAAFPEATPNFPCIIINPVNIKIENLSVDRSKKLISAEVSIDLYAKVKDGKVKIDQARDNIMTTILNNFATLKQYGLIYDKFDDDGTDTIELRDNININIGIILIIFTKLTW